MLRTGIVLRWEVVSEKAQARETAPSLKLLNPKVCDPEGGGTRQKRLDRN
jgi:hypothetical protein